MTSDPAGPESALGNCGLEGAERMRAIPSSSLPTGRGGLRPPLPRCPPGVQGAPGGEGPQKHAGPCRAGTRRGGGRGRTAPLRCADARRDPPTHGTVSGRSSKHPPSLTDTKRKKAFLPCAEDSEDPLPTGLPRRTAVLTKAAVSHSAAQRTTGGCALAHLHPGPCSPPRRVPPSQRPGCPVNFLRQCTQGGLGKQCAWGDIPGHPHGHAVHRDGPGISTAPRTALQARWWARGGLGCLGLGRLHPWPDPHAGRQGPRAWAAWAPSAPQEHPQQLLCRGPLCGMVLGLGPPRAHRGPPTTRQLSAGL